jgi:hypothetical protein
MGVLTEPYTAEDGKVFPVGTAISVIDAHEAQISRLRRIPTAVVQPVSPPVAAVTPVTTTPAANTGNDDVVAAHTIFLARLIDTIANAGSFDEVRAAMEPFATLATAVMSVQMTPAKVLSEFRARLPQVMNKLQG